MSSTNTITFSGQIAWSLTAVTACCGLRRADSAIYWSTCSLVSVSFVLWLVSYLFYFLKNRTGSPVQYTVQRNGLQLDPCRLSVWSRHREKKISDLIKHPFRKKKQNKIFLFFQKSYWVSSTQYQGTACNFTLAVLPSGHVIGKKNF